MCKFDIEELTLVIKLYKNIRILHGFEEIVEFLLVLLFLFVFCCGLFLLKFQLKLRKTVLPLYEKRLVDLDAMLTFTVKAYEEI